jgi:hypothetical protein
MTDCVNTGRSGQLGLLVLSFSICRSGATGKLYAKGTYTHNNIDFTNDLFHLLDWALTSFLGSLWSVHQ